MPYAIKVGDKYLKRSPQGGPGYGIGRARSLVDTLEEATTWRSEGHAKTAWIAAVENKAVKAKTTFMIVEVVVKVGRTFGPYEARRQMWSYVENYRKEGSDVIRQRRRTYAAGLKVEPARKK